MSKFKIAYTFSHKIVIGVACYQTIKVYSKKTMSCSPLMQLFTVRVLDEKKKEKYFRKATNLCSR